MERKYWPQEGGKKKCEVCLQHVDSLMIAAHCFLFVRVSEESSRCPFEKERQKKKEAVVSNGTKANPYVTRPHRAAAGAQSCPTSKQEEP